MMKIPDFLADDDTGNWSTGKIYSSTKIDRWLIELDNMEVLANFGSSSIEEDFNISEDIKIQARINALHRFLKYLEILIHNTKKLVRLSYRKKMEEHHKIIKELKKHIDLVAIVKTNEKTKTRRMELNEKIFNLYLSKLEEIKCDIIEPLNKSNLVFRGTEEVTLEEKKTNFIDRLVNEG